MQVRWQNGKGGSRSARPHAGRRSWNGADGRAAKRTGPARNSDPLRGGGHVQHYRPGVAEELAALARKGVRVRVYRDREQFQQETQWGSVITTSILLGAGIEVRVKGARDLMHLKSYAIDGRLLRTGSANWSPTGLKRQDNDVRYESTPEAVELFERKFAEMWSRAGNIEAEARTSEAGK